MSVNAPRIVWVTGASSGIGQASVIELVEKGHRVVAVGRRIERLKALRDQLGGDAVYAVASDVQDLVQLRQSFQTLPDAFRPVDTLVNCAGLMLGTGNFDTLDAQAMQTMVMTNCIGVLHNTSVLLPSLKASGRGHIINVGSIGARHPYVGGHVYAATKAFVEHFGENLRPELVPHGVRVTNISPGRCNTEFQSVRTGSDTAPAGAGGLLEPQDVARAICWALAQPAQVNVNTIELVPASQVLSFR